MTHLLSSIAQLLSSMERHANLVGSFTRTGSARDLRARHVLDGASFYVLNDFLETVRKKVMRRLVTDEGVSRRRLLRHAAAWAAVVGNVLSWLSLRAVADDPARFSIGLSVQGRPIAAIRAGAGPVRIVLVGGIHTGNEINTVDLVATLAQHFTTNPGAVPVATSLTFIPALNVDGIALGTRTNARDVDLNRNWPARWQPQAYHDEGVVYGGAAPLSEPETAALYAMLQAVRPHAVLSWHSEYPPSGEAEGNNAALGVNGSVTGKTLARAFAADAGMDYLDAWTAYPITGQLLDTLEDLGTPGMDIELPSHDGVFLDANLAGLQRVIDDLVAALR